MPAYSQGEAPENEDQLDRNLPSEMKHRPKIPRTPNRKERERLQQQAEQQNNDSDLKLPQVTKNGKPLNDDEVKEFEQAFKTRERIVRSPPDDTMPPQKPMRGGQG